MQKPGHERSKDHERPSECGVGGEAGDVAHDRPAQAYRSKPRRVWPRNKVCTWAASFASVGAFWAALLTSEYVLAPAADFRWRR